ncbi:outer membrane beta-barrel protein [Polluticaenibacter yanchengensis]|uniref:Outer membrane beta-barrel protein n=1 Tax=Polluticaenibacter yanchengensis TaxID=3014562 RepID=A0ABT4UJH5_9BACT|nr:outer membrane beta-barrel protein [Chitinophagaceae bacterium LY-5]
MKKFFMAAAIMGIVTSGMAQKDSWYIGGNVGFSSKKDKVEAGSTTVDGTKTTSWTFSPEIGTFLTNNWQVGVGLNIGGAKTDPNSTGSTVSTTTRYGGTLYTRYFFGTGAFRPFLGANATVLPGKIKNTIGNTSTELQSFNFGINGNAGFAYALAKRVTAVGSLGVLGFEHTSNKAKGSDVKTKTNSFGLDANSLGNRFTIGVYYTL